MTTAAPNTRQGHVSLTPWLYRGPLPFNVQASPSRPIAFFSKSFHTDWYMRVPYDLKLEAVDLYREHPASTVIEMLGLNVQPRTVQRWAGQVYGAG